MSEKYGKFADKLGGYIIDKLPDAGNYEYRRAKRSVAAGLS